MNLSSLRRLAWLFVSVVFGTLFASAASAQFLPRYAEVRVTQMHYRNTGGEQGRSIFFYGRDGVLCSGCWLLEDRSRYSAN